MLTTRIRPKMRVKPLATTKNSAASVIPFRVTTAKVRQSSLALTRSHTAMVAPIMARAMRRLLHPDRRGVPGVSAAADVAGAVCGDPLMP